MTSVFSKIVAGEIPSHKIFEDDLCLAFLDINPVSAGHTLVITKEEFRRMTDVPDELLGYCFMVAKDIMSAMKEALGCDYVMVHVEWLEVPHFHIHLIPGWTDKSVAKWEHTTYTENEATWIADKIAWKLSQNT